MQMLSRIPDAEFFNREVEMARLLGMAGGGPHVYASDPLAAATDPTVPAPRTTRPSARALLLGAPRCGKSEILRKTYDRLFTRQTLYAPIYLSLQPYQAEPQRFAGEFLAQFLAQFLAFRKQDARMLALADEPLAVIARNAPPDDYHWVRKLLDAFVDVQKSGDRRDLVRTVLTASAIAASRTRCTPFLMLDNFHLLVDTNRQGGATQDDQALLLSEFVRLLSSSGPVTAPAGMREMPVYVLCGLRRLLTEMLPPDEDLYQHLELIRVEALADEPLEQMLRASAARLGVELSDSTTELMMQQLGGDLFYTRAMLDAAAADSSRLKSFMEFERLYTGEVLQGRICHYLSAVLREVAPEMRARRGLLEALYMMVESSSPIPLEAVLERVTPFTGDAEKLLARMHARELVEISYGFVSATTDTVLADYVRTKYRTEIAGANRPVAGEELLGEKLKHSYRLMMSRYNRSIEQRLVDLLSRFDFQAVPASLFNVSAYESQYPGTSRAQARQSLDQEEQQVRLPQLVLVNDLGSCEIQNSSCRLFSAGGFDGGIYSEASEALWMIALLNSKEPVGLEQIEEIEQRWRSASRLPIFGKPGSAVRWFISKEGFTAAALERVQTLGAHSSTNAQLDLLYDYLVKHSPREEEARAANEVELVIPIEDEAELIAARTVEQIARAADFDKESINQIKTALIEACINAAEHGNSPDRKIYHRFAIIDDRLVIRISNKGSAFAGFVSPASASAVEPFQSVRGRGLKIIRGLMDDVRFERSDDGTTLVMTKLLKRQEKQ